MAVVVICGGLVVVLSVVVLGRVVLVGGLVDGAVIGVLVMDP